jgi:hypothetical protein
MSTSSSKTAIRSTTQKKMSWQPWLVLFQMMSSNSSLQKAQQHLQQHTEELEACLATCMVLISSTCRMAGSNSSSSTGSKATFMQQLAGAGHLIPGEAAAVAEQPQQVYGLASSTLMCVFPHHLAALAQAGVGACSSSL